MKSTLSLRPCANLSTTCMAAALAVLTCATQAATFEVLHRFGGEHGTHPQGAPVIASNGDLYGTTTAGGRNDGGTLFRLSAGSDYRTITYVHAFPTLADDGHEPTTDLVADRRGNVYGTTYLGGKISSGIIFKFDPAAGEEILWDFGQFSEIFETGLARGPDGTLYGAQFSLDGPQLYALDPTTHELKILLGLAENVNSSVTYWNGQILGATVRQPFAYDLDSGKIHYYQPEQGAFLKGGVTPASDGTLWGTIFFSDAHPGGALYRIDAEGNVETMHAFEDKEGAQPQGVLTWGNDGKLYGTNRWGGACAACGTVYRFDPDGRTLEVVRHFKREDHNGLHPLSGLSKDSAGHLYGVTNGTWTDRYGLEPQGFGVVYRITP